MPAVAIESLVIPPDIGEEDGGTSIKPEGKMINGKWNGKYNIHNPTKLKYAERTPFLQGICGHIDHEETLEDVLRLNTKNVSGSSPLFDLRQMAQQYYIYKNKGARLPKFSRWVTGMFAGNEEFAKILAEEGQKAAKRKIIMSVDVVDILRSADTKHFYSCFAKGTGGGFGDMPKRIVEECPGIGIVYVDDEQGFMMGRQWMHHAKVNDTGEDIIVLTQSQYGCLDGANVARLMHDRGIRVAIGGYYGDPYVGPQYDRVTVNYVGCFTSSVHHDLDTWKKDSVVSLIKPAFINKKKETA